MHHALCIAPGGARSHTYRQEWLVPVRAPTVLASCASCCTTIPGSYWLPATMLGSTHSSSYLTTASRQYRSHAGPWRASLFHRSGCFLLHHMAACYMLRSPRTLMHGWSLIVNIHWLAAPWLLPPASQPPSQPS